MDGSVEMIQTIAKDLEAVRQKRPLVHSITNLVVMNETANAVLCIGALPIMSHAPEEVEEMVSISNALVLNIGTLTRDWVDAMELAGTKANELGIPVIFDPVGAGATRMRTDASKRLLDRVRVSIVRGNAAEVASLAGISSEVKGVESIAASESPEKIASEFARTWGCVAAITGATDVVSDGTRTAMVDNGHVMLSKVVGTGCMSNVIIAAFAGVSRDPFRAAIGGLAAFAIAGELAASVSGDRPGTFHTELYNALYALTPDDIRARGRMRVLT